MAWVVFMMVWVALPTNAIAQSPLVMVDDNTTVRNVSFRFVETRTFDPEDLSDRIATRGPSFFDRIQDVIPLMSGSTYRFSPLELQRDVQRLKRFYERRGFPAAEIDYPASQYNEETNTIHVIFSVNEGPPVIIQDVTFFSADSVDYAVTQFPEELRDEWIRYRDQTTFQRGNRYSEGEVTAIETQLLRWIRNRGYPYSSVDSDVVIDTTNFTADLNFYIDPGVRARIASIEVEGNESVSGHIVRREIPVREGDWYHHDRLVEGQRELFGLNMFRVALFDIPEQERDSTVTIRYDLQEGNLRYISANTGYGRNIGLSGEGRWTHRNFLGAGRDLTISGLANTGFFSTPQDRLLEDRRFRGSVTLRQPYAGYRKLSVTVSPFIEYQSNPLLAVSDQPFGVNAREFGFTTTLLYEIHPFRTVSLQHTFARALQFTEAVDTTAAPDNQLQELRDLYDRSTISLNAQLGRADEYVSPRDGFLIRPSIEYGPRFLGSQLEYIRASTEATGYLPITRRTQISGRINVGRLWPRGHTNELLAGEAGTPEEQARTRSRFNLIRFYAGGSNDLRGWAPQMAGDKRVRQLVRMRDDLARDTTFAYEPLGGSLRIGYNAELRMPFPGLGSSWRSAIFLDAGHIGDEFSMSNFRYGTGAGVRYITPVGHIRLDLAAKINPTARDMRDPATYFREGADADPDWWRRFRIHLSIGQAF